MKSRPYLLEMQSGGNGADVTGVVAFLGFLTYIGLMIYMFLPLLGNIPFFNSTKKASVLVTPTVIYQPVYPPGYTGVTIGGGSSSVPVISTPTAFELVVIQPTYTALPTYTPYPTQNAFPLSNHRFSFYDPLIGKDKPDIAYINCEKWNEVTLFCDSALRNGEAWQDNYFISAACPYDLYLAGAYFEVVSPDWLVTLFPHGFTCKDTGDAVTGLYIDFLIPWQSMPFAYDVIPWGTPITLRRLR